MNISGRQFAKLLSLSPRQLGRYEQEGLIRRHSNGLFRLEDSLPRLFRELRDRLTLAERLCHQWCPGELESWWEDRHG